MGQGIGWLARNPERKMRQALFMEAVHFLEPQRAARSNLSDLSPVPLSCPLSGGVGGLVHSGSLLRIRQDHNFKMYQRYTSLETFQNVMLTLSSLLLETTLPKEKSAITRLDQNTSHFVGDRGPLLYVEWVLSSTVVRKIVFFVLKVRIIIYTNGKKVIGTFLLNLDKRSMFLFCNISRILLLASLALPCLASFAF